MNYRKKNENICFICKSEKMPLNIEKIRGKKLKNIISKIIQNEANSSILINKCNCKNNKQKSHKICLILNIIFNFDLSCKECKSNYNISISKKINNYKKFYNICSFIFLLFFHIVLYGGAAFLILYIHLINKDIKQNFEENKLYHIYYFFAVIIFIINTLIIAVTFSSFLDKNNKDICNYDIEVKDINEDNKMKNSDKIYELLYKFFRFFYHSQIRYLIERKQKHVYMSKGFGNFNKDIKDMIIKNKEEFLQGNIFNNGGKEDILNINNKLKSEKIKSIKIEESNGKINSDPEKFENLPNTKNEEEKNNESNKENEDKNIILSEEKKSNNNSNNINIEESLKNNDNDNINIIENEENLDNKNDLIEREQIKEIEKNIKEEENQNKINEEKNNMSIYSDKIQEEKITKTFFYKKINNNNLLGKSKTLISKKKSKKKNKKEKKEKYSQFQMKITEEEKSKKYSDSTMLAKEKDKKNKIEETQNYQIIEDDPFDAIISAPARNIGK